MGFQALPPKAHPPTAPFTNHPQPPLTTPNYPPTDNLIQLAKMSGIKGAKSITCPDNRIACPGNYAVNIIVGLNNTLDQFKAVVPQWRANIATAASVSIDKVGRG